MGATAKGLDGIIKAAEARAARARDLGPALRVASEAVKNFIDDSFRSSTDGDGNPFVPNKPSTIKSKKSSKPLIDTGHFRSSITATPMGKNSIRFGTNVPYAMPVIDGFLREGTLKGRARYVGGHLGVAREIRGAVRERLGQTGGRLVRRGSTLGVAEQYRTKATLFQGPRRERHAGDAWTSIGASRNPFPVSPLGRWLGSQRASALLSKVGRITSDWIMRGRL